MISSTATSRATDAPPPPTFTTPPFQEQDVPRPTRWLPAVILLTLTACSSRNPLNRQNFGKIFQTIRTQGVMELSEVEHILGGPGAVVPDPWGDPFTEFSSFADDLNGRYRDTYQKFRKQVPMKLTPGPVRDRNGIDVVMVVEAGPGEAGEVPRWL
jgi:hypothetical protein